jgi:xanthine/CO dehydrogenase XdhC/CoxF family maturation factor
VFDYLRKEGVRRGRSGPRPCPARTRSRREDAEEIALSVLSEIVLHRRSGSGEPMRDRLWR